MNKIFFSKYYTMMMIFDPSDLLVAECQSCLGPPPAGGGYGNVVNVSMSEKNKKIEKGAALLDAAVQPRKGIDRKGAVTRKDPRKLPKMPPDVFRTISKHLVEGDEAMEMKEEREVEMAFWRSEVKRRTIDINDDIKFIEESLKRMDEHSKKLKKIVKRYEDRIRNADNERDRNKYRSSLQAYKTRIARTWNRQRFEDLVNDLDSIEAREIEARGIEDKKKQLLEIKKFSKEIDDYVSLKRTEPPKLPEALFEEEDD